MNRPARWGVLFLVSLGLSSLALLPGCGNRPATPTGSQVTSETATQGPDGKKTGPAPLSILGSMYAGGDAVGPDGKPRKTTLPALPTKTRGEFERKYTQAVQMMEQAEFGTAIKLFEEIVQSYPATEEASVAEYCIANIHFCNKNNDLALEAFKKIVERYPETTAAENARAGIEYLTTFEDYEKDYVSPDVEDRKRRGF